MTSTTETLIGLEQERCRCIVEEDFAALGELLSARLIHTHTRGNMDGRDSYLNHVHGVIEILDIQRESLRVVELGPDAAVMHGKQINQARLRGKPDEPLTIESIVTQVWARENDHRWRLVAFQATPLGAPPPAIPR